MSPRRGVAQSDVDYDEGDAELVVYNVSFLEMGAVI